MSFDALDKILERLRSGPPPVGVTPAEVVHTENKWRLLRYVQPEGGPRHRTPVLLVPSLINRHYVLDLMKDKSFAQWMVEAGHDVFIIDWGTPGDEDRFLGFDDVCERYLGRAVRKTARLAGVEKIHLLGYCLGGTLTAIYTAVHPEQVGSLVVMAAPVGFHDDGLLSIWMRNRSFDVRSIIEAMGNMPWPMMQASFQMLKPTLNLQKLIRMAERAWDDEFMDGFFAIEWWGNDNVSFPGEAYAQYIEQLYRDDALLAGRFRLNGKPARLEAIDCPLLAVTFGDDHIVPKDSAAVLVERVASSDKRELHLRGGHVGAVVSKKAKASLWPALSEWWATRDAVGPRAPRAVPTEPPARPLEVVADPAPPLELVVPPPSPRRADASTEPRPTAKLAPKPAAKRGPKPTAKRGPKPAAKAGAKSAKPAVKKAKPATPTVSKAGARSGAKREEAPRQARRRRPRTKAPPPA
jgi:polyhydroxyalkanoate synthase